MTRTTADARRPARVALLIETSNAYGRGILQGVNTYIHEHGRWSIHLAERGRGERAPAWLVGWSGDGILARIENATIAKAVLESGLPAVDLCTTALDLGMPSVRADEDATIRLAIEHLRERGYPRFGYYSLGGVGWWSENRREHFRRLLSEMDAEHFLFERSEKRRDAADPEEQNDLQRWIARLPKPIGLMAGHDLSGHQVLNACRSAGILVPDQVAVIGVHNDELICELSDPPLSSVIPDTHRIGYVAAGLLDRMMAGRRVKRQPVLIPPMGIVARRSTDMLAMPDQDIANAVRFIRQHACEGIKVDHVVKQLELSRRSFEQRFRKHVGRSPHSEILRVQLDMAKQLLSDTDLKLSAIAARCGFTHHEYMNVVFKRHLGQTPGQFRARRVPPTQTSGTRAAAASGKQLAVKK